MMLDSTREHQRLHQHQRGERDWHLWGPYLSERSWGTVREDYSAEGDFWEYFPHDHARSRAYRWNEDGLGGICDREQYLCFALAFWNGKDAILKERLFGLTGPQGNHGEDVKEYYFYLDSTPTHSYLQMVYKYPHAAFPYQQLQDENRKRGYHDFEYELLDTGIFDQDRYFDIFIEYAKASEADILIQVTAFNRGPESAPLHLLPTLWFRNTWSWGYPQGPRKDVPTRPALRLAEPQAVAAHHPALGRYTLYADSPQQILFTENETNNERLFGVPNSSPFVKDAFHRYLVAGEQSAVNPAQVGTKAAAHFLKDIPAGGSAAVRLRLVCGEHAAPFEAFAERLSQRQAQADAFFQALHPPALSADEKRLQRQALAGMLWSKQIYYYDVAQWLDGDPAGPTPPAQRLRGRNKDWRHLNNFDILSMPDKWEYPWYAAWDLAFHTLPLALIDPGFAKEQLLVLGREWYMHPNGQLPAYEGSLEDVNPPVHAWAAWRVYKIDAAHAGEPDTGFLEAVFHKLLLNFTWWVNRKDVDGRNIFQGGFLGLDNISLFDRSAALPAGGRLDQSDATAWMGFFCLVMLKMSLELSRTNPVYQGLATKFFEHFLSIARAMTQVGGGEVSLWDQEDGFYYDELHFPDGSLVPLKVRSLVGLIPLLAVETIEPGLLDALPEFTGRMHWFMKHKPGLTGNMARIDIPGEGERILTAIPTREKLVRVLRYLLDENEFLSPYGIRSLSKVHQEDPVSLTINGQTFSIQYEPAESQSGLFGGNSNWRGPVWFPINYLLIEALQKYHHYYGDKLKVEFPTGSGQELNLWQVATELSRRLIALFTRRPNGSRPVYGGQQRFQHDPHWRDNMLFYEYFHGDNGAGLGASHQTGWTGLVAKLLQQSGGTPNP